MSLFHSIRDFIHFTRMYQWHPGKMPLILGFAFTMLLAAQGEQHGLMWVLAAYILTCQYLATAYMFNNVADTKQDRIVHKRTGLDGWSYRGRLILVIIFMAIGIGSGVVLLPALAVYALIGCYILFAWCYSFPPRFKEHTVLGPFVAAFAHIPAPALVMAAAFGALPLPVFSYLTVAFLYGLRMILVHQRLDYENDRVTGTHTTVIALGVPAALRLLRWMFVLEVICTAIFLILIVRAGLPMILLITLAWPLFLAILRWIRREPVQLDSYSYIPLADVHESLVPLILAVGVAMRKGNSMIVIIPLVVFLFLNRHIERLIRPLIHWREIANA
jgi:4-hydroxybenzoate polyprenyltransferase